MKNKRVSAPRVDYRNPFLEVRHRHVDFGSFSKDYFVVELGPRAGIVALREGSVLLARQYRFLIDDYSWELPGGKVDEGETPESAAVRECLEETGIRCSGLQRLIEYYPGLDNFNNRTTLFVSNAAETVRGFEPDEREVVEIRWMPMQQALAMAWRGEILDGLTVVGLLAATAGPRPAS